MIFLIFIIVIIAVFYIKVYREWNYNRKFVFKSVLIYLGLGFTALMLFATVAAVGGVIENQREKMLPTRLEYAEHDIERSDYTGAANYMVYSNSYEEEFEYIWERVSMYECCLRYRFFAAADEKEMGSEYTKKAKEYEKLLSELCGSPEYSKNIPYGEYFWEQAGLGGMH